MPHLAPKSFDLRHSVGARTSHADDLHRSFNWQIVAIVAVLILMVVLALQVPSFISWWNHTITPRFAVV